MTWNQNGCWGTGGKPSFQRTNIHVPRHCASPSEPLPTSWDLCTSPEVTRRLLWGLTGFSVGVARGLEGRVRNTGGQVDPVPSPESGENVGGRRHKEEEEEEERWCRCYEPMLASHVGSPFAVLYQRRLTLPSDVLFMWGALVNPACLRMSPGAARTQHSAGHLFLSAPVIPTLGWRLPKRCSL